MGKGGKEWEKRERVKGVKRGRVNGSEKREGLRV